MRTIENQKRQLQNLRKSEKGREINYKCDRKREKEKDRVKYRKRERDKENQTNFIFLWKNYESFDNPNFCLHLKKFKREMECLDGQNKYT